MTKTRQAALGGLVLFGLQASLACAAWPGEVTTPVTPNPLPEWSQQAQRRLLDGPGWASAERAIELQQRVVLLQQGEQRLATGDVAGAEQAFDAAALLLHAADTEVALVRTYLQGGEYRRALGFAAHAAGAHRELAGASALHAWLLHMGGYSERGAQVLRQAVSAADGPADDPARAVLQRAQQGLARPWPVADAALLDLPLRFAPYAVFNAGSVPRVPAELAAVGSATLAPDGHHALVPTALLGAGPDAPVWLRNGLGRTVSARLLAHDAEWGVSLLQLDTALPWPSAVVQAAREPFAGSPGALVEFGPDASGQPAWPVLRQGFLAQMPAAGAARSLGITAPAGPRGGPVFNASGQWLGMAVAQPGAPDRLLSAALLVSRWPALHAPATPTLAGDVPAAMSVDLIYEHALLVALQVLRPATPSAEPPPSKRAAL